MSATDDAPGLINRRNAADDTHWIVRALDVVLALALVVMLLLLLVEIVARNFLDTSTLIADEYSAYGLVVVGFLGLGRALATGSHVRVGALLAVFAKRRKVRQALEVFSGLALLAFAVIGTYQLGALAIESWQRGTTAPTIMRTPLYVPQAIATLGFFLLGTSAISFLIRIIRGEHVILEGESKEVDGV